MKELKTVFLVDDDDTTNFLNKFFVSQLDSRINVVTLGHGKAAIDYIESIKDTEFGPSLLILDTNMPVMNGWEFLAQFDSQFSDEIKSMVKVIMVTALESEEMINKAVSQPNVVDTVQKPLSDHKFRKLIKKHFMAVELDN